MSGVNGVIYHMLFPAWPLKPENAPSVTPGGENIHDPIPIDIGRSGMGSTEMLTGSWEQFFSPGYGYVLLGIIECKVITLGKWLTFAPIAKSISPSLFISPKSK